MIITNKNSFDIEKISTELKDYCKSQNIGDNEFMKIPPVIEEYLTNILFPNFEGDTEVSIINNEKGIVLKFNYEGKDYMNKITDDSFLSLKIIENKTKDIKSYIENGKTTVEFLF